MPTPTSCSACCSISRATPCRRWRARAPNDPARDQIRITGRREGAVVVIEVSDTGPGFPAKAREHLFEAFQGSTRTGGTGLGLAIAAELVRAHGGEIRLVEGTIGATFRAHHPGPGGRARRPPQRSGRGPESPARRCGRACQWELEPIAIAGVPRLARGFPPRATATRP